jgi:hypothetical protein
LAFELPPEPDDIRATLVPVRDADFFDLVPLLLPVAFFAIVVAPVTDVFTP